MKANRPGYTKSAQAQARYEQSLNSLYRWTYNTALLYPQEELQNRMNVLERRMRALEDYSTCHTPDEIANLQAIRRVEQDEIDAQYAALVEVSRQWG